MDLYHSKLSMLNIDVLFLIIYIAHHHNDSQKTRLMNPSL